MIDRKLDGRLGESGESKWLEKVPVPTSEYAFCEAPVLMTTGNLGPCIGVCVAWQMWAGICHIGALDEYDMLPEFLAKALGSIPPNVGPKIRPIICGGDTLDDG